MFASIMDKQMHHPLILSCMSLYDLSSMERKLWFMSFNEGNKIQDSCVKDLK